MFDGHSSFHWASAPGTARPQGVVGAATPSSNIRGQAPMVSLNVWVVTGVPEGAPGLSGAPRLVFDRGGCSDIRCGCRRG